MFQSNSIRAFTNLTIHCNFIFPQTEGVLQQLLKSKSPNQSNAKNIATLSNVEKTSTLAKQIACTFPSTSLPTRSKLSLNSNG